MPISDVIANGIRPPQVEDMQSVAARGLSLASAMRQDRLGRLQIDEAEREMQEQQKARQVFMESGGDLTKYRDGLIRGGFSPKLVTSLDQSIVAARKAKADASAQELKNDLERQDMQRGRLQAFVQLPKEQKPARWAGWVDSQVQAGLLRPEEAAALPREYPGDEELAFYANGLAAGSQLSKEEMERRNAAARERTAQTGVDRLNLERPGIEATNLQKGLAVAGQSVDQVSNQASYDAWRAGLPADVAKRIPAFFSPSAVAIVKRQALTAEQQVQADQAKTNAENNAKHDRAMEEHAKAMERRAADEGGGGKLLTPAEAAMLQVPYGTTREQAQGKMPATQQQGQIANYATRIQQANDYLGNLEDLVAGRFKVTDAYQKYTLNSLKSEQQQSLEQAERNFINAVLRRESGAVIQPNEFEDARKQYLPVQGDDRKTLAQKRLNRQLIQRNFIREAGNAYQDPGTLSQPSGAPAPGRAVRLRAPDGTVQSVPANQVDHYLRLGAKRVD